MKKIYIFVTFVLLLCSSVLSLNINQGYGDAVYIGGNNIYGLLYGNNIWTGNNIFWNMTVINYTNLSVNGTMVSDNIYTDYIDFNTSYTDGYQEGRLQWNIDDGVLEFGLPGGNVVQQLGLENLRRVKANGDINNGDVVYVCGSTGNRLTVCKTDWDSYLTSLPVGVATENIQNNQFGYINSFGYVRDIDTTGEFGNCNDGDIAWLSNSGGFTCNYPDADKFRTVVGIIVNSHASVGILDVSVDIVPRLEGLSYVNVTNLQTDDILIYNSTSSLWENKNPYTNVTIKGDFVLETAVEDDLRFPVNDIATKGASNIPEFETFKGGTLSLAFDDNTMEQGYVSIQFPHSRKMGTSVEPHFHWSQTGIGTGNVTWCIEYTWANINEIFPDTTTRCVNDYADGTAYKHLMTDMIVIDGTNKTGSGMMNLRLYRDATNSTDTLSEDAYLLEFDIHIYKDKLGETFS